MILIKYSNTSERILARQTDEKGNKLRLGAEIYCIDQEKSTDTRICVSFFNFYLYLFHYLK